MIRYIPGVKPPIDLGPTNQDSFSGSSTLLIISDDYRYTAGAGKELFSPFVAAPQTYEFLLGQPDQNRYAKLGTNRFVVDTTKRVEGATNQQTDPIPGVTENPNGWFEALTHAFNELNPRIQGPNEQFDGAATPQTYEFVPNQPDQARYDLPRQFRKWDLGLIHILDGATSQPTYEFTVGSPDQTRYDRVRQSNRFLVEAVKRLEGATSQQKFEFPVNQPELIRYDRARQVRRFIVAPVPRFESTPQQTYEFFPGQPPRGRVDINRFKLIGPTPQLDGPVRQQTYEFLLGQPPRGQADINRWIKTGSVPQLDTVTIQTFDFWYTRPDQRWRQAPARAGFPKLIDIRPVVDTFNPYVPTFPRRDWFPKYRDPKFSRFPGLSDAIATTPCMAIAVVGRDGTVLSLMAMDDTQVTLGAVDDTIQAITGENASTSIIGTDDTLIAIIGTDGTVIFRRGIC